MCFVSRCARVNPFASTFPLIALRMGSMSGLGDRIRAAREAKGWTQAELAQKVGVARETVGNWETGVSSPRNKTGRLVQVLGSLGTSEDESTSSGTVLLDLPPSVLEGLTEDERQEVIARAKATAMQAAREIRRHD